MTSQSVQETVTEPNGVDVPSCYGSDPAADAAPSADL